MHFHYAGYLIQRIRFQASDPLLPALKECGYHTEPDIYTKNTICVEFPLRAAHADSKNFASAGTVSIEEQFATQAFLHTGPIMLLAAPLLSNRMKMMKSHHCFANTDTPLNLPLFFLIMVVH